MGTRLFLGGSVHRMVFHDDDVLLEFLPSPSIVFVMLLLFIDMFAEEQGCERKNMGMDRRHV